MQSYSKVFADVYNIEFTSFVKKISPIIESYYSRTEIGQSNKLVLDLCCGTGHLASYFASMNYKVIGIDSSKHMLRHAYENNKDYLESGQVRFIEGDVSQFSLNDRFGLIVSTYDSINHLETEELLESCFRSAFSVLAEGGYFLFDLNTRASLSNWNSFLVRENKRLMLISRGIYDGVSQHALIRISGFVRESNDRYKKFDQTIINSAFELNRVQHVLLESGWKDVQFVSIEDLEKPVAAPELIQNENELVVIAHK